MELSKIMLTRKSTGKYTEEMSEKDRKDKSIASVGYVPGGSKTGKRMLAVLMAVVFLFSTVSCGVPVYPAYPVQEKETGQEFITEGEDTKTEVEYSAYSGEYSSVFPEEGDKIAVISPSALPNREQTDAVIAGLKAWGYEPVPGDHVCDETRTLDDVIADLTWALEDPEIKAIFCVRGGYGASEVADVLSQDIIRSAGKLIIGYSDITVYHSAWTSAGVPSIHACMSAAFDGLSESCLEAEERILKGEIPSYTCAKGDQGIEGRAKGILIGGNLSTFTAVIDSAYDCTKTGRPYILFLEDVGEDIQHIHRYLTVLKHTGVLDNAAGIVFGEWAELPVDPGNNSGSSRGGRFESVADMISRQFLSDLDIPVAFGFPAGHGDVNYPLLMGEIAQLRVGADKFTLTCGAKNETDIDKLLGEMTLREKVEQMMIVSYRVWKETPETGESPDEEIPGIKVTELNDEIKIDLKNHDYGGVILFGENFEDAKQVVNLISDIQNVNQADGGLPLFVAVDQEGGKVARISFGTTGPGNMALAATGDPDNARKMAEIYGKEMGLLGINTDFAPVADINNNPNNPVIGTRSFSDSPEVVSEYVLSYMEGLHNAGIIATLKHFPGHGNTDTDSHTGFPCIDSGYDELKESELIPFKNGIDAGADMVMTAHIQYPQIETETYTSVSTGAQVYIPATMSHKILTDILRDDMGFEGVVVSDALSMAAIAENFSDEDVLAMMMKAGVDLVILPGMFNTDDLRHVQDMVETAVKLAEDGAVDEKSINDSVRRILTLKKKYGLLEQSDFASTDELIAQAESGVGSDINRKTAWDITEKALTLVKNDDQAFPIKAADEETALILFCNGCAGCIGTGELVKHELYEQGKISDESQIVLMTNDRENEEECVKAAEEADHCILVYRTYNSACLDPATDDGFSSAVFDRIIDSLHKKGKQAIVVSCQLPYDAARFEAADAMLLSYNFSEMSKIPAESGAGSAYAPNLAVALMACFEDREITGRLPVTIPKIDESYQFTDEILYLNN